MLSPRAHASGYDTHPRWRLMRQPSLRSAISSIKIVQSSPLHYTKIIQLLVLTQRLCLILSLLFCFCFWDSLGLYMVCSFEALEIVSSEWMEHVEAAGLFFYDMNSLKRDDLSFGRLPVYIEVVLDDDHTAALELEVVVLCILPDEMRWDEMFFEVLSARLTRQLTEYEFQFFAVNLLACLAAAAVASFLRISIRLITSVLSVDGWWISC